MNILIVDDEPLIVDTLSYLVSNMLPGVNIHTEETATMAISLIDIEFDICMIDLHGPGQEANDITHLIDSLKSERIYIMTGDVGFDNNFEGIDGILYKPFSLTEVEAIVSRRIGEP